MPDYDKLVRLFIEPLVDSPEAMAVDAEITCGGQRVWLRISFDAKDKGRVYGRGGRTIQAIRQVLGATAQLAGQRLYVDIYDPQPKAAKRDLV